MSTLQEERRKQALAERAKKAGLPEWQQEMVENVGSDVVADVVRAQGGELLAAGSEPGKMVERSGICSRSCWREAVS